MIKHFEQFFNTVKNLSFNRIGETFFNYRDIYEDNSIYLSCTRISLCGIIDFFFNQNPDVQNFIENYSKHKIMNIIIVTIITFFIIINNIVISFINM